MSWFNYYGLAAVVIILIPNIVCAAIDKSAFENKYNCRAMLVIENIGRYGCMVSMTFNIPYTYFDFLFDNALIVYLSVNGALLALYIIGWIVYGRKSGMAKALWLSIAPAAIFLFGGVMLLSVPLIMFSVLFGIGHITVSVNNAK